ncbi:MAG: glycosyltransferase [Epsilonproteobacteria bacterium]|nr:glycosyltransferase [Campylobacterota bacterium]
MKPTLLVTVVIPAYNHAKYIQEAIDSVIDQTYKNIELIIINDGSSDKTHEKIMEKEEACRNRFVKFTYLNRENKGLINTLNEALNLTHGEYFSMLGSDDYYYRNKIEKQIDFFKNNVQYALHYGNVTFVNSKSQIIKNGKTKSFKSGFVFDKLIYKNFIPLPSVMVKTKIVKEIGGFDTRFFLEDYPLWLKIAKKYKIGFTTDSLTHYRVHNTQASGNILKMIKETEKILLDWKAEKYYKHAINQLYLRWFSDLVKTKHIKEAEYYMLKALPSSFYKPRFIRNYIKLYLKKRDIDQPPFGK